MSVLEFDAGRQAILVARSKSGDKVALAQLYDETFPVVYAWAVATLRNREDAEDITSEAFERAMRSLHKFESRNVPVAAWIVRIARNVAHEHWHKRSRIRLKTIGLRELETIPDQPAAVNEEVDLDQVFASLTRAQRDVLLMRMSGMKVREVASVLGCAEGTVKAQQFVAIRKLRKAAQA